MLETLGPNIITGLETVAIALPILAMAFSEKQRKWVNEVWGGKCAAGRIGMKHKCKGDVQIHHVIPQMWGYAHGMTEEEVDSPLNAFPACSDAHVGTRGTQDCFHPDQAHALTDYTRNDNKFAFGQLQERRQMMTQSDTPYWNERWDNNVKKLISATVDKWFRSGGSEFPVHNHRNGK